MGNKGTKKTVEAQTEPSSANQLPLAGRPSPEF
jgi:hypothetical protein